MLEKLPELSIVIPVFNQEKTVVELYFRLTKSLEGIKENYELIFVDDGSIDRSYELLKELRQKDERIRIVKLLKNFGEHPALIAGLNQIKGKIVVTLSANLEDPPEFIPKLLSKLREGYHVVGAYRSLERISWSKKTIIKLTNYLLGRLTRTRLRDYSCLLRAYKKSVIEMLLQCRERTGHINPLTAWLGVSIAEIEIPSGDLIKKQGFFNLFISSFNLLTNFSPSAIQAVSLMGLAMAVISPGLGLIWIICWPDYRLELLKIVLLSLQLVVIALVGRYLGQIYLHVQGRPYYIIEEIAE